jgi:FMN phosphatase YigB (HAD superfamily)
VLCVGDSPVTDIGGALSVGIDACWFAPNGEQWPDGAKPPTLVIRDLLELTELAPAVPLAQ